MITQGATLLAGNNQRIPPPEGNRYLGHAGKEMLMLAEDTPHLAIIMNPIDQEEGVNATPQELLIVLPSAETS